MRGRVPRWTPEDRKRLAANYGRMSIDDLCGLLGRTKAAVWQEAKRRGIYRAGPKYTPTHGLWNVVFETRAYL